VSVAARLVGLWVRVQPGAWLSVLSIVCCQRSLQRTDHSSRGVPPSVCVSECDRGAWILRRPWPTEAVAPWGGAGRGGGGYNFDLQFSG